MLIEFFVTLHKKVRQRENCLVCYKSSRTNFWNGKIPAGMVDDGTAGESTEGYTNLSWGDISEPSILKPATEQYLRPDRKNDHVSLLVKLSYSTFFW